MLLSNIHLQLLNAGYAEMNGDWNWKNVRSRFSRFYYVRSGEAFVELGDREERLSPGHLYLIKAFTQHGYRCTGQFCHYYLHVYDAVLNDLMESDVLELPFEVEALPNDDALFSRICVLNKGRALPDVDPTVYDNDDSFHLNLKSNDEIPLHVSIETEGILLQVLSRFLVNTQNKLVNQDPSIAQAIRYISDHIADVEIEEMARCACMSRSHFNRVFFDNMGTSPSRYIAMRRIEKAKSYLQFSDLSVSAVGEKIGIEDVSYFIRFFKAHTGVTPLRCRAELRQNSGHDQNGERV